MVPFTPQANFPEHNLKFYWRWWDQIQATFKIFSTLPNTYASLGLAIVKNVEEFIDNTIGEDCEFECRPGYEAIPNLNHQSTTNGCGSLDLIFDDSEESFIHVEQEFTQVGIQKLRHLHLKYANHVGIVHRHTLTLR